MKKHIDWKRFLVLLLIGTGIFYGLISIIQLPSNPAEVDTYTWAWYHKLPVSFLLGMQLALLLPKFVRMLFYHNGEEKK